MTKLLAALWLVGATAVAQQVKPMEPLIGTLEIDAPDPRAIEFVYRSGSPLAGWLFVNGELRGTLPIRQRLLMSPGVYDVRIVMAVSVGYPQIQFLTIRWPRTVITQGGTVSVRAADEIRRFPMRAADADEKFAESHVSPMENPLFENTPSNVEYLRKGAADDMANAWKAYMEQGLFAKVHATASQLAQAPPSRPVVWLDVPESYGGAREFDVEQLRILQQVLSPDIKGWRNRVGFLRHPMSEAEKEAFADGMKVLEARNAQYIAFVDQTFDFIVSALEKAGRR